MSCTAEVRWRRKYPRGMIEEISPRFNRPAPKPNHDKCGPNCRFWLRKKINYYNKRNRILRDQIWYLGEKTDLKAPYGLGGYGWNKCDIWDVSHADTIAVELELYNKNLKCIKKDNKRLNRLHVNIHKLIKESNSREQL